MKLSLNWLKELLPGLKNVDDSVIISTIEQLGYEIENVTRIGENLSEIKVVKILDVRKHPSADKLTLCDITDGINNFTVVCGATNVHPGMVAPYISAGNTLPDGTKIEARKIRGIESNGMLCSQKELRISDDHSGIMELNDEFKLGDPVDKYLSDVIVDITTPPNRYDCLGHIGIARELAVKFNLDFKLTKIVNIESKTVPYFEVNVESSEICSRYFAVNINNVNNTVSLPYSMRMKLINCGIRSINPLVDISNYVLLEVGHSVHIFDSEKLASQKIIVRKAKPGEKILALDGKEYQLDDSIIIISDTENPIAIGGIIGGEKSAVDTNTKSIVIESAVFNRKMIHLARKKLKISTEASYRFERGSGWEMCEYAAFRTLQLILKYCGGTLIKFSDYKDIEYQQRLFHPLNGGIKVSLNFVSNLLGTKITMEDVLNTMRKLGAEIVLRESPKSGQEDGHVILIPPVNRQDINFQADVAEEIARFKGYDIISDTLPTVFLPDLQEKKFELFKTKIINYLVSNGFNQAMNYSICSSEENTLIKNYEEKKIEVVNPVSKEYTELRTSLLPGLVKNVVTNFNNQVENILLFETGKIYYKTQLQGSLLFEDNKEQNVVEIDFNHGVCGRSGSLLWREEEQVGIIVSGQHNILPWKKNSLQYDFYFINGVVENLFRSLNIKYKKEYVELEKIDSGTLNFNQGILKNIVKYKSVSDKPVLLAITGEVEKSKFKLKIPTPVFYSEIYLENIFPLYNDTKYFTDLPQYPSVVRDLSLVVPENVQYDQIINLIKTFSEKNKHLGEIVDINIFDYFKKENITAIALTLKLQHKEKTLTDDEVNKIISTLLDDLKTHNIELRK